MANEATVFFSITYDGLAWSTEYPMDYGVPGKYGQRFIAMRLGYVNNYFAFKFRWTSRTRMAFAAGNIEYG